MYYELILLAAGQGKRMGASQNKILLHLLGKPVIVYSIEAFLQDKACGHIILVVQSDEEQQMRRILRKYFPRPRCHITVVVGGAERQDSVFQGLQALKQPDSYVFVHDGARPFIVRPLLKNLYQTVTATKAAILGVPVKDTIKRVDAGQVVETIPRDALWQVQTPQAFLGTELMTVHQQAQADQYFGTDDASLIEQYSERKISLVLGSYENIKLTTPDDMLLGEAILRRRIKNN